MAKEKSKGASAEKIITLGLRKEWRKVPRSERIGKAAAELRRGVSRAMDSKDVKISQRLNDALWSRGVHRPPGRIKVKATLEDGVVTVHLPEELVIKKEHEKPSRLGKLIQRSGGGKLQEKLMEKAKQDSNAGKAKETPKPGNAETVKTADAKDDAKNNEINKNTEGKETSGNEVTEKQKESKTVPVNVKQIKNKQVS